MRERKRKSKRWKNEERARERKRERETDREKEGTNAWEKQRAHKQTLIYLLTHTRAHAHATRGE